MRLRAIVAFAVALAAVSATSQSIPSGQPPQHQWVSLTSSQTVSISAEKPATIDLHFTIAPRLHINSHTPASETLIPTRLAVTTVPGLKVGAVDYPPGEPFTLPVDPSTKLDVYTGEFVLKTHVVSQRGSHLLQGTLRYQACDNAACYPPKTLPFAVSVVAQ